MKRLGEAELEIMQAVWGAEEAVTSGYVHDRLRGSRNWALPAVVTSLNRLVEKGFLSCEKRGRGNLYRAAIDRQTYMAEEGRGVLDRLFGGSVKGLVTALYDGERLGRDDIEDLRRYLEELEEKR